MPHLPRYWRAFRLIKSLETCVNLGQLQEDIFQCLGKDLVNNTLIGYNSTIFSYGYVYACMYICITRTGHNGTIFSYVSMPAMKCLTWLGTVHCLIWTVRLTAIRAGTARPVQARLTR